MTGASSREWIGKRGDQVWSSDLSFKAMHQATALPEYEIMMLSSIIDRLGRSLIDLVGRSTSCTPHVSFRKRLITAGGACR